MSWNFRTEKAQIAIKAFIEICKKRNFEYAYAGYENYKSSDNFKEKIKQLKDNTSFIIRFFPDFYIAKGKNSYLAEIKNSKFIERDAYNTYMYLNKIGYKLYIIFFINNKFYICYIQQLKIQNIKNADAPIINNKWIAPRKLDYKNYIMWKKKHSKASGTTYGCVDFENTNFKIINYML